MKTIAFIPVRGGSKSIPNKNIKPLLGRPLLHWSLDAAVNAAGIDEIYVSSDSEAILRCANDFGHSKVKTVVRAAEYATDSASTESAMLDFAKKNEFDRIVLIQATSPLTRSEDLDQALSHITAVGADSLVTVTHEHRFRWGSNDAELVEAENYDPRSRPRRQDWSGEYVENGAFYITSRERLLKSECRLSGAVTCWVMPPKTAVEIDEPSDWEILESILAQGDQRPDARANIRVLITDVDGVWTDGGMYYGADGESLKKFNTRDGMGTAIWRASGRAIAVVTGENSLAVVERARKLGLDDLHVGVKNKLPVVEQIARSYGVSLGEVAYIGDDLNDLEALSRVGLPACPADAHRRVRERCIYVTQRKGGEGCLREFIEWVLGAAEGDEESSELAARKANI